MSEPQFAEPARIEQAIAQVLGPRSLGWAQAVRELLRRLREQDDSRDPGECLTERLLATSIPAEADSLIADKTVAEVLLGIAPQFEPNCPGMTLGELLPAVHDALAQGVPPERTTDEAIVSCVEEMIRKRGVRHWSDERTARVELSPLRTGDAVSAAASCPVPATPVYMPLSKQSQALALLVENPEWTNRQIAKAAGCHERTLYKSAQFRAARAIQKRSSAHTIRGSKSMEGDVEAWEAPEA